MTSRVSPLVFLYDHRFPSPELQPGQIALAQVSSPAFGDGSHPTTRLCAGAVDLLCRQKKPNSVLDVGTGTAVLARIARLRGAGFVVGTEIDPIAMESAKTNVELDQEVPDILICDHSPGHWGPRFNLVVANILEEPLRSLAQDLTNALAPGGDLLLSGFTRMQIPPIKVLYESFGLLLASESSMGEWVLLHFTRPD